MKKIKITNIEQLKNLKNDTKIEIVGSSRERWLFKMDQGLILVDEDGGFDLTQDFINQNPMIAFIADEKSSSNKKLITKISQLRGLPDGTPVEFGSNDRDRNIYGCEDLSGEILIVDDGGGFILDQNFLDSNPIYITVVDRSELKPSLRFMVFKRDKYRCQTCGVSAAEGERLEVDHKIPLSKGGSHLPENLWTLCFKCNRGKGTQLV